MLHLNWCFVADPNTSNFTSLISNPDTIVFILVAGKQWEILTYIGVILIYTLIAGHLWRVLTHAASIAIYSYIVIFTAYFT